MVELKAARAADASFAYYQAGVTARFPNLEEKTDDIASSLTTYQTKVAANSAINTPAQRGECQIRPVSCLRPWGRLRIYATTAPEGAVSRVVLAAEATVECNTSTAAMFMYADGAGRNWIAMQTDPFALAHGLVPNAPSSTPFCVQGGTVQAQGH